MIDTLAVFIKKERAKARSIEILCSKRQKEDDSSWESKYPIRIHGSIIKLKAKGNHRRQVQYESQVVRFAFNWQKSEVGWRRDHLWVQEYLTGIMNLRGVPYPWQSRMMGELQLVLTVRDEDLGSKDGYTQLSKYTWALVNLLRWR